MAGASTCKADAGVSETRAKAARTPCTCKRAGLENSIRFGDSRVFMNRSVKRKFSKIRLMTDVISLDSSFINMQCYFNEKLDH